MPSADVIISIKPDFAEAILKREKTVELRRRIPATQRGTRLWIYATKPIASIVGTALVEEVARGTPRAIWDAYKDFVGITRTAFFEYFADSPEAVALVLVEAKRCIPVSIDVVKRVRSGFHPPQVLIRISSMDAAALGKLARVA